MTPSPGAYAALQQGCLCPTIDNHHGKGLPSGDFWVDNFCPLHGEFSDWKRTDHLPKGKLIMESTPK